MSPAFDPTNLEDVFRRIVDLFNGQNFDQLQPFLHPQVTMNRVDDPGSKQGIGPVIDYLKTTQTTLKPKFEPDYAQVNFPELPIGHVEVSGPAGWRDRTDISVTPITVKFIFTLTRANPGDRWLVIRTWAHR